MTRLLLTLLVSFVPQLYGAEMTSTQRAKLLTQIEATSDLRVRAKLIKIYEDLNDTADERANLLYCTLSPPEQNDAVVIDYEERRSSNSSKGQIVAKEQDKDARAITYEVLPQEDGYVRKLGGKKRMIYKFEVTPFAYTFKTKTTIPGGNYWQIDRVTGELTGYRAKGPCEKAEDIRPKF
jgi:hypothetical protein